MGDMDVRRLAPIHAEKEEPVPPHPEKSGHIQFTAVVGRTRRRRRGAYLNRGMTQEWTTTASNMPRYDRFMYLWLKRHMRAVLLVGVVLAMLPSYLWPYSLTGASAAPTILVGDTFIVNRAAYDLRVPYSRIKLLRAGSPRRGDIVQAHLPSGIGLAIKRVLGLPGETIEVHENRVMVNGAALPTQTLDSAAFGWVPEAHRMGSTVVMEDGHWAAFTPGQSRYRNCPAVQLGPGEYFLMGDNRDNSFDSRAFGPVSRERIIGKAIAVLPTGHRGAQRRD